MGMLDQLRTKLGPAREKVADLAEQHGDQIDQGIRKAAKAVDERTKGKYSDRIQTGTGKAKNALDRLAHKDGGSGGAPPPAQGS